MGIEPQRVSPEPSEPEQLAETSKKSIEKLKSLVDGLKTVEDHEKGIPGETPNDKDGHSREK